MAAAVRDSDQTFEDLRIAGVQRESHAMHVLGPASKTLVATLKPSNGGGSGLKRPTKMGVVFQKIEERIQCAI